MLWASRWACLLAILAPWAAAASVEDQDLAAARRQLDTGDWNSRIRTVHELEYMQEDAIAVLTLAAVDGDWQVRMAAVHALAPLGPKATPILRTILKNEPCPVVRLIALHDLGSKGADGAEEREIGWIFSASAAQINACRDQSEPGRAPWAAGLEGARLRPPAAAAPAATPRRPAKAQAEDSLPESNELVVTADVPKPAAAAPKAPAAPTKTERYAELDALLAEPRPETLPGAPEIGRRPSAPAAPALALAAPARRGESAAFSRRRLGPSESLPRPVVTTAGPDRAVQAPAAFEASGSKAPHDALPDLLLALKKGGVGTRSRAADELGSLGAAAASAVPALTAALKDKSPRVRASASLALGNIGVDDATVVPLLVNALKDKSLDVRYAATLALSRVGTPAAREAFKKRLGEDARREIDQ